MPTPYTYLVLFVFYLTARGCACAHVCMHMRRIGVAQRSVGFSFSRAIGILDGMRFDTARVSTLGCTVASSRALRLSRGDKRDLASLCELYLASDARVHSACASKLRCHLCVAV